MYWLPEENEKIIYFKIYKRQYYEEDFDLCKFYFNMRYSWKGGEIKHDAK